MPILAHTRDTILKVKMHKTVKQVYTGVLFHIFYSQGQLRPVIIDKLHYYQSLQKEKLISTFIQRIQRFTVV